MATWATYWSGPTATDAEGRKVAHIASNQFASAGVAPGDCIYVLTYLAGQLHVVTSLVVDHLVPQAEAERILKRKSLWEAEWHVIARPDSVQRATMSATLTSKQTAEMIFVNQDGEAAAPARNRHGAIDPQTFRTTRLIDTRTAAMLRQVLESSS